MQKILLALLWIGADALAGCTGWLDHLDQLSYWEKLAEIRSVSDLPMAMQRERVPDLADLLTVEDSSVRIVAAEEIAEIREVADSALSRLVGNFWRPNGEEGMTYIAAVVSFGERALPSLQQALASRDSLVRARACDALLRIYRAPLSDGRCRVE